MTDFAGLLSQLPKADMSSPEPLVFDTVERVKQALGDYRIPFSEWYNDENASTPETLFDQLTKDNEARLYVQLRASVPSLALYRKVLAVRTQYNVPKETEVLDYGLEVPGRGTFRYVSAPRGTYDTTGTLEPCRPNLPPRKLTGRCIAKEFKLPHESKTFTAAKHPNNVSETMRFHEDINETIARLCQEELRFIHPTLQDLAAFKVAPAEWFDIRPGGSSQGLPLCLEGYYRDYAASSSKYPGLPSYKDINPHYFAMPYESFRACGYCEVGEHKTNAFVWDSIAAF